MREFLRGLELEDEMIDTIMAEYGKLVTKDKEELTNLKGEILSLRETSKNAIDLQDRYDDLINQIEQDNANKKAKAEEETLTRNIIDAIGDKQFVNDYTKNSIINEMKSALKDEANVGKSAKDLFAEITNGKEGLFANPNQFVDMPSVNENVDNVITKEAFDKMGYQQRIELKQSNPDLFNKYNN
jgi:DNA recombination-dependent growth factor C